MRKLLFILFLALIPAFFAGASSQKQIKILLVPGHDNEIWGAQYGNIKEADMNLVLANQIYNILKKDKRFKVWITRDKLGYTTKFADYLSNTEEIRLFKENAKAETLDKIADGDFLEKEGVFHNAATEEVAIKLYGINKWADENMMDAVIHIHFNDYLRQTKWTIGKYKGFAIYMPDGQMANAKESAKLAGNIYSELRKKYKSSTYEKETGGLVPDQKLIALGANHTLDAGVRSVLIEYGYIYQKIFRKSSTRHQAYKDMADLTAKGIKKYFFGK